MKRRISGDRGRSVPGAHALLHGLELEDQTRTQAPRAFARISSGTPSLTSSPAVGAQLKLMLTGDHAAKGGCRAAVLVDPQGALLFIAPGEPLKGVGRLDQRCLTRRPVVVAEHDVERVFDERWRLRLHVLDLDCSSWPRTCPG
eukprot:16434411-Heterocapsa_arctica.AAC.2